MKYVVCLICLISLNTYAMDEPFTPEDNFVLLVNIEHEPNTAKELNDVERLALVAKHINSAKVNNDPRFYGLAEGLLAKIDPSKVNATTYALYQATLQQQRHDFRSAISTVKNALLHSPNNENLRWLMHGLQYVSGQRDQAKAHCQYLADYMIQSLCFFSINAYALDSTAATSLVSYYTDHLGRANKTADPSLLAWAYQSLFEIAEYHGRDRQAERIAQIALNVLPNEQALSLMYADLLIRSGRSVEAHELLQRQPLSLGTHIRLAIAEQRAMTNMNYTRSLEQRDEIQFSSSDQRHDRELAMYHLFVKNDYEKGLTTARNNWSMQRELIDYRLLFYAAAKSQSENDLRLANLWKSENKLRMANNETLF